MPKQIFTNNAASVLSTAVNTSVTSLVLSNAAKFPSPTGGDWFYAALVGLDGNGTEISWEIVKCTARATNTLTVIRAQEGTVAAAWPGGTRVELRITAEFVNTVALAGPLSSSGITGAAASGGNTDITSLSGLAGNVNFTGTGNRITGDFSNATLANRLMFQTSVVNSSGNLGVLPNGTGVGAGLNAFSTSDADNSSFFQLMSIAAEARLASDKRGTGTYLPMTFSTGNAERMRIDTSGNVLVTGSGGLGYGAGSGGTVTQATSKSTAVTLNKPCGKITTAGDALAAGASVQFTCNNSLFTTTDNVVVNINGSGAALDYSIRAWTGNNGLIAFVLKNESGGSLSQAVNINFAIIKGATA